MPPAGGGGTLGPGSSVRLSVPPLPGVLPPSIALIRSAVPICAAQLAVAGSSSTGLHTALGGLVVTVTSELHVAEVPTQFVAFTSIGTVPAGSVRVPGTAMHAVSSLRAGTHASPLTSHCRQRFTCWQMPASATSICRNAWRQALSAHFQLVLEGALAGSGATNRQVPA